MNSTILSFSKITMQDVAIVGGKSASLGEMICSLTPAGISVPDGFAVTVHAFRKFMSYNGIHIILSKCMHEIDPTTLSNLSEMASRCRDLVMRGHMPQEVQNEIIQAYDDLMSYGANPAVAVRSSATAEDSPTASFAGQHDSFLNVSGSDHVIEAIKKCYASFYNERAIKYRMDNKFPHEAVGLAVAIQMMVRSDKGSAGVIFTLEPETGNENLIYVTGAWGLGESVVQGAVNTDEFYVFKPALFDGQQPIVHRTLGEKQTMLVYSNESGRDTMSKDTSPSLRDQYVLTDNEVVQLSKWSLAIERHYQRPMDVEWAKDGETGKLYIVQARPETIHSQHRFETLREYSLSTDAPPLLQGKAVGRAVVAGRVVIVKSLADSGKVREGDIIVADITNPDWNALLRKAVCIVTNKGGRTSHASIVARELGIPAVVGTLTATETLTDGQVITVSCVEGEVGSVYRGRLSWQEHEIPIGEVPETTIRPMIILADPQKALVYARYPSKGVGLLRMEFMIANTLQVHPMALIRFSQLPEDTVKKQIEAITRHHITKEEFFVNRLAESIGIVAAAFYPREVIVRMSDFKSNEYAKLLGGNAFEVSEENPMLGFRGASRYYHPRYQEGFGLECRAVKRVRDEMQLTNVKVMIPFCRTVQEGSRVLDVMKSFGLERGRNGLQVYVMAEIPSNILLASKFADFFDGFSIGSNDLTQLTLGLDRDSAIVSHLFDENNEAVTQLISSLVKVAHKHGLPVGLCGQAPSDSPEFAKFLVGCGIDSISFNPDALIRGMQNIVEAEQAQHVVH